MRQVRIQLSGRFATLVILLLSGALMLLPARSTAQSCSGTLGSFTYDTTYVGPAGTNGTSGFDFLVPKFPVNQLTLYAVTVQSHVSVTTDLTVQNASLSNANGSIRFFQADDVSSTPSGDISGGTTTNPAFTIPAGAPLAPGASKYFPNTTILSNYLMDYDTIGTSATPLNPMNYSGTGTIDFSYNATNTPLVIGPFLFTEENYVETVNLSVTYYFCNPGSLASDIVNFTAVKQNNNTVQLDWSATNEQAGRKYVIEVSPDGDNFSDYTTVASEPVNSNANYSYSYPIDPNASGKLYFRLRIIDEAGPVNYSIIKIIDLDHGTSARNGFFIYPNPPTDYIYLNIPGTSLLNWQVDIIAADGRLVQRNMETGTSNLRVNFTQHLASGTYFVRAVNAQTLAHYTSSFVIK